MTKEEFANMIAGTAQEVYGGQWTFSIQKIENSERSYTGMSCLQNGKEGSFVIDIDEAYKQYLDKAVGYFATENDVIDFHAYNLVSDAVIQSIGQNAKRPLNVDIPSEYEQAKGKLFVKLINAEKRRGYLETIPHKKVCDLALTVHILLARKFREVISTTVTDSLLEKWGVDKDTLMKDAIANSEKINPLVIDTMSNVLFGNDDGKPMLVVTNEELNWGAASILYEGVVDKLKDKLGDKFYLIPSSVHEFIVVSPDVMAVDDIAMMVRQINIDIVAENDRLSDHVYKYTENGLEIAA